MGTVRARVGRDDAKSFSRTTTESSPRPASTEPRPRDDAATTTATPTMAIPSPSDGRETRPYRASISASATTWRRSHLALSLESRDGTVSAEAVVRPDATALSVRGDVVDDDDDDDDDDFVASTLVFGGGGGGACVDDAPPAAVRVRVTGPIATVHWVSISRGGVDAPPPTFFYCDDESTASSAAAAAGEDDDDDRRRDVTTMTFRVSAGYDSPARASTASESGATPRTAPETLLPASAPPPASPSAAPAAAAAAGAGSASDELNDSSPASFEFNSRGAVEDPRRRLWETADEAAEVPTTAAPASTPIGSDDEEDEFDGPCEVVATPLLMAYTRAVEGDAAWAGETPASAWAHAKPIANAFDAAAAETMTTTKSKSKSKSQSESDSDSPSPPSPPRPFESQTRAHRELIVKMLRDRKSARVAARALHAWYATQTREYAERQLAAATQIAAVALESTAGDKQRRARVLDRDVTRCVNRRTTRALAAYFRPWAVFTAVRVSTRLAYVSETTTNDAGRRTLRAWSAFAASETTRRATADRIAKTLESRTLRRAFAVKRGALRAWRARAAEVRTTRDATLAALRRVRHGREAVDASWLLPTSFATWRLPARSGQSVRHATSIWKWTVRNANARVMKLALTGVVRGWRAEATARTRRRGAFLRACRRVAAGADARAIRAACEAWREVARDATTAAMNAAAVTVQTRVRGWIAAKAFAAARRAAVACQKRARGAKARRDYHRTRAAVVCAQSHRRGKTRRDAFLARRALAEEERRSACLETLVSVALARRGLRRRRERFTRWRTAAAAAKKVSAVVDFELHRAVAASTKARERRVRSAIKRWSELARDAATRDAWVRATAERRATAKNTATKREALRAWWMVAASSAHRAEMARARGERVIARRRRDVESKCYRAWRAAARASASTEIEIAAGLRRRAVRGALGTWRRNARGLRETRLALDRDDVRARRLKTLADGRFARILRSGVGNAFRGWRARVAAASASAAGGQLTALRVAAGVFVTRKRARTLTRAYFAWKSRVMGVMAGRLALHLVVARIRMAKSTRSACFLRWRERVVATRLARGAAALEENAASWAAQQMLAKETEHLSVVEEMQCEHAAALAAAAGEAKQMGEFAAVAAKRQAAATRSLDDATRAHEAAMDQTRSAHKAAMEQARSAHEAAMYQARSAHEAELERAHDAHDDFLRTALEDATADSWREVARVEEARQAEVDALKADVKRVLEAGRAEADALRAAHAKALAAAARTRDAAAAEQAAASVLELERVVLALEETHEMDVEFRLREHATELDRATTEIRAASESAASEASTRSDRAVAALRDEHAAALKARDEAHEAGARAALRDAATRHDRAMAESSRAARERERTLLADADARRVAEAAAAASTYESALARATDAHAAELKRVIATHEEATTIAVNATRDMAERERAELHRILDAEKAREAKSAAAAAAAAAMREADASHATELKTLRCVLYTGPHTTPLAW